MILNKILRNICLSIFTSVWCKMYFSLWTSLPTQLTSFASVALFPGNRSLSIIQWKKLVKVNETIITLFGWYLTVKYFSVLAKNPKHRPLSPDWEKLKMAAKGSWNYTEGWKYISQGKPSDKDYLLYFSCLMFRNWLKNVHELVNLYFFRKVFNPLKL